MTNEFHRRYRAPAGSARAKIALVGALGNVREVCPRTQGKHRAGPPPILRARYSRPTCGQFSRTFSRPAARYTICPSTTRVHATLDSRLTGGQEWRIAERMLF